MTTEPNQTLVRRAIEDVENQRNLSVIDELYAPDVVSHRLWPHAINPRTMVENEQSSLAERKRLTAGWHASFPDSHTTIEQLMAEGDRVMCWTTTTGTHTSEHFGIAPTGKHVTYSEFWVVRIAEGRIAEEWMLWDRLGFFQQLGIVAETRTLLEHAKRPVPQRELIATGRH